MNVPDYRGKEYVFPGVPRGASEPGYNEHGCPLYRTAAFEHDAHYWAYVKEGQK